MQCVRCREEKQLLCCSDLSPGHQAIATLGCWKGPASLKVKSLFSGVQVQPVERGQFTIALYFSKRHYLRSLPVFLTFHLTNLGFTLEGKRSDRADCFVIRGISQLLDVLL